MPTVRTSLELPAVWVVRVVSRSNLVDWLVTWARHIRESPPGWDNLVQASVEAGAPSLPGVLVLCVCNVLEVGDQQAQVRFGEVATDEGAVFGG